VDKLPWIPGEQQWLDVLGVFRAEPVRNRVMLALAYDAALRREELCALRTDDVDPGRRMLRVRAETTKTRRGRAVPYSAATGALLAEYLAHRATLSRARGPLFLSESRRNMAEPLTLWTWSKVVRRVALAAEAPRFSMRHLCLTERERPAVSAVPLRLITADDGCDTAFSFGLDLAGYDRRLSLTGTETAALAALGAEGLRRSRARGATRDDASWSALARLARPPTTLNYAALLRDGLRPALDPAASAAPSGSSAGRPRPARPSTRRTTDNVRTTRSKPLRFQGIASAGVGEPGDGLAHHGCVAEHGVRWFVGGRPDADPDRVDSARRGLSGAGCLPVTLGACPRV
jgi:hypothetical protein